MRAFSADGSAKAAAILVIGLPPPTLPIKSSAISLQSKSKGTANIRMSQMLKLLQLQ
jgi:hypothetical protein